jgi:hypothetical protein
MAMMLLVAISDRRPVTRFRPPWKTKLFSPMTQATRSLA